MGWIRAPREPGPRSPCKWRWQPSGYGNWVSALAKLRNDAGVVKAYHDHQGVDG
jgi:hypothetical protein